MGSQINMATIILLYAAIGSPATGFAQQDSVTVFEEIIVTAQKREQRIVDVPIAMTALDSARIHDTRAKTIADIQGLVPNFSFESVNGFDNISIRGVGGGGRSIGFDPRSGLYIDGVYIGQAAALAQPLFGIKQVEVLRGPQGHLFGRNTVSGAVSLRTQGPPEEVAGSFSAVVGNEDTYEANAWIGGPLGEKVRGKVGAAYETRAGFGTNVFTGQDTDDLERMSVRGQLSFLATEKLTIDVFADYSESEIASPVGEAQTTGIFSSGTIYPTPPWQVDTNVSPVDDTVIGGTSITINYDPNNEHTITSISAYRYSQQDRVNDTDYSPADSLNIDFDDESSQISQEIRLISPDDRRARYVLGIYYLNEEGETLRLGHLGTDVGGPVDVTINSTVDTTTYAAFASMDVDLSDVLTLNLGARYTTEDKDVFYSIGNGFLFGLAGTVPFAPIVTLNDSISENQFTPMVGLTMAISDRVNVYAKYTANGFKSGGFNTEFISDAAIAAGISFAPETVDSVEVGIKGTLAGGRASFDAAVFNATYEDFQILQFVEVAPGLTDIQLRNAAEVDTKGIEASATFYASDNVRLGINAAYLDAEFAEFRDGGGIGVDFDGNELPNSPRFSGAFTAGIQIPVQSGAIDLYGEFSYRDDTFSIAGNDPAFALSDRSLVNGRVSYSPEGKKWSIGLWGRNLLDEDYVDLRAQDFLGNQLLRRGEPRTWGAEWTIDF